MNHQARDEMNITGQPVQLGDGDRTTLPARFLKRGGKLPSPVDGIGPFPGLDLDVYASQLKALGGGESHLEGIGTVLLLGHDVDHVRPGRDSRVSSKLMRDELARSFRR
jgi:hypothetical protein